MTPIVLTEAEKEALAIVLMVYKCAIAAGAKQLEVAGYAAFAEQSLKHAATLETLLARSSAEQESSNEHD